MKTKKNQQQRRQSQSGHKPDSHTSPELTFLEHLYELRTRLFWIVGVLLAASTIGLQFKDILVGIVMAPLHGEKLVYLTPGGGFSFIFSVCMYFGTIVTIPIVIYHIYRFLQPLLGRTSRRLGVVFIFVSILLAAAGVAFGYFVTIPAALNFLTNFAGDAVASNLTAESYMGFVMAYMLGLAVLFQLPLLLLIIDRVRPFPPGALLNSQRYVLVGSVIVAAIITPTPDVVNQAIVAGPVIGMYQLGAIAVYVRRRRRSSVASRSTAVQPAKQPEVIPQAPSRPIVPTTVAHPPVLQVAPAASPVLQPQVIATPQQARPVGAQRQVRSIDGMRSRPVMTARPVAASAVRPVAQTRPFRSIDGMMMASSRS